MLDIFQTKMFFFRRSLLRITLFTTSTLLSLWLFYVYSFFFFLSCYRVVKNTIADKDKSLLLLWKFMSDLDPILRWGLLKWKASRKNTNSFFLQSHKFLQQKFLLQIMELKFMHSHRYNVTTTNVFKQEALSKGTFDKQNLKVSAQLLCILTSFWVLQALGSWLK